MQNRRRLWRAVGAVLLLILILIIAVVVIWLQPYRPSAAASQALQNDSAVLVSENNGIINFVPQASPATPSTYAVHLRAVAA